MNSKINQLSILISQIQNQRHTELSAAQEWMLVHAKDAELKKIIPKMSVVAFHVLDVLALNTELNGIKIAELLGVTRSGITRAARKLKEATLIEIHHHADNKKNVYYRLTAKGRELSQLHQAMHTVLYQQTKIDVLAQFSDKELDTVIRFLTFIKGQII